ncbi:hypothetical protein TWF679_000307 [Orbilia oligospora]|uniref:Uncharacterized protein n=1 Tax=Orbilia oligospora TaxID=2813651 RepID=A0A8H8VNN6_ORBOL|nr:hypothetical protein TWF679_000307 [Orbilia oligospora]
MVFGFHLNGFNDNRRIKSATIEILFQDLQKRVPDEGHYYDPEPIALWPQGVLQLSETSVEVQDTKGVEVGGDAGAMGLSINTAFKTERQRRFMQADKATIHGSIRLDFDVRKRGPKNAIRLQLHENKTGRTGGVNHTRAVVLLQRKNQDQFTATVKVDASADILSNAKRTLQNLFGMAEENDPVIFNPGVDYISRSISLDPNAGALGAYIDDKNLGLQVHKLGVELKASIFPS